MRILTLGLEELFNRQHADHVKVQVVPDADDFVSQLAIY